MEVNTHRGKGLWALRKKVMITKKLMASLEMSGKLQLCIWRSRMARWKSGREEGTLRCTGLLPARDHAAEADSTYRKKNFTQDFECSLIVRSECVPGTAGFLSAGLVNLVQKPHAYMFLGPLSERIFLTCSMKLVLDNFRKQTGGVSAAKASVSKLFTHDSFSPLLKCFFLCIAA